MDGGHRESLASARAECMRCNSERKSTGCESAGQAERVNDAGMVATVCACVHNPKTAGLRPRRARPPAPGVGAALHHKFCMIAFEHLGVHREAWSHLPACNENYSRAVADQAAFVSTNGFTRLNTAVVPPISHIQNIARPLIAAQGGDVMRLGTPNRVRRGERGYTPA